MGDRVPLAPFPIELIAPPRCGACGDACPRRSHLCPACAAALRESAPIVRTPGPPGVEVAVAAGEHGDRIRRVATGIKFGRRLQLAGAAAEAMADAAEAHGLLTGGIVPVPPDPLRVRVRGFDPAEELAAALAEIAGLPLVRCLERRTAPRQVGRDRAARVARPARVGAWRAPPRNALLVDDVWTTGATLSAAALALRAAGTEHVAAVTLAHAL